MLSHYLAGPSLAGLLQGEPDLWYHYTAGDREIYPKGPSESVNSNSLALTISVPIEQPYGGVYILKLLISSMIGLRACWSAQP